MVTQATAPAARPVTPTQDMGRSLAGTPTVRPPLVVIHTTEAGPGAIRGGLGLATPSRAGHLHPAHPQEHRRQGPHPSPSRTRDIR